MKTMTTDAQIDTLFSTVFQESHSPSQTVEYLDRMLTTFRQFGRSHRQYALQGLFADDELFDN